MKLVDHIGIFENCVPSDLCGSVIKGFNEWEKQRYQPESGLSEHSFNEGTSQFHGQGAFGRSDLQLFLESVDIGLAMQLNTFVGQCFEKCTSVYNGLVCDQDPVSSWTTKIQRTQAGGGYHVWHCENGVYMYRDRVLTWMIYLNDIPVENGGATEFMYQKLSLQPTQGTIVLWPAAYTHMHRGGFLTGDVDKYIATGWFLREPGNASTKVISQQ